MGLSIETLSAQLGRSARAVGHMRLRLGLPPAQARHRFRAWSDREDADLRRTEDEAADIAIAIGRTTAAVRERLRKVRPVDRVRWDFEADQRLRHLYAQGLTLVQIASELSRSMPQVASRVEILRKEDPTIQPRRPRWTNAQRERLALRYCEGASLRQLEAEFDRTRGTITSQLRTLRRLGFDLSRPG